jgi:hypothetical protein
VIDTFSFSAPVPEPSGLLLFGTVLAGWSGAAWGRYRRK